METDWLTKVATTTKEIDIKTHSVKQNNQNEYYRTAYTPYVRKFMVGPYKNSGSFDILCEPENAGNLLWLLFGDGHTPAKQGETDAYLHEFIDADTIKHATLLFGNAVDASALEVVSAVINKLSINCSSKGIALVWNYIAATEGIAAMNASPTISSLNPFAGHNWHVEIGGAEDTEVRAFNLEIERQFDDSDRAAHSRFMPKPVPGDFLVSGKVDVKFTSTAHLKRFWGASDATGPGDDIAPFVIDLKTEGIICDTPEKYQFNALMPRCIFNTRDAGVSQREKVIENLPFTALYDSTYSIKMQLKNMVTDYFAA